MDQARARGSQIEKRRGSVVVLQPKGEVANLLSVQQPTIRLGSMVLPEALENASEELSWSRGNSPNFDITTCAQDENSFLSGLPEPERR